MILKIIIATHKKYLMPDDQMYHPVQVGKQRNIDLGYTGDNTGDNISLKNSNYCELTAMYWAWKNIKADFLGLVHYRRHFCNKTIFFGSIKMKQKNILSSQKATQMLRDYDAILPKKRHYWIETNYSQYAHAHNEKDLIKTRDIIDSKWPDYTKPFDEIMKKKSGHRFNMFIMKQDLFNSYSEWLFDILFQLEKEIDITSYSPNDARVFGFISERLLDVWLEVNKINYVEMPVMHMEKQNWFKKISNFMIRKWKI